MPSFYYSEEGEHSLKTPNEQAKEILEYSRKRSQIVAKLAENETRSESERARLRAELEKLDKENAYHFETR